MGGDNLLVAIEAIHAAGLGDESWPSALQLTSKALGAAGATLEVFDKKRLAHTDYHFFGLPPAHQVEYANHYLPLNPRVWSVLTAPIGHIGWDYQIFDEAAMRHDPFYADFLPQLGVRYFLSGTFQQSEQECGVIAIQRTARQGHAGKREIELMRQLVPHVRQAFDVARRLRSAGETRHSLERAVDLLADGVVLLRADGAVVYANESMCALARSNDGLRLHKGALDFAAADTRVKFNAALASAAKPTSGHAAPSSTVDFMVPRPSGKPPYLVSVRPLTARAERGAAHHAAAMVFVRDPVARRAAAIRTLRELFGLTAAEAALAQALQGGTTLAEYARTRALSLNTVYTHLRRVREKTGCSRMAELIHKLNELHLPLRLD